MADTAARLAIYARRNEVCRFTIAVSGIDLTGVDMNMQVRLGPDVPGAALITLATVGTLSAEGLKLDSVTTTGGVPTSIIKGRVNASTMTDATKVPYMGEVGDATALAYAMQWTLGGDARTRLYGDFVVLSSAYGSDNAPTNRPAGYGSSQRSSSRSGSGSLTFGDQVIRVSINGLDELAPLVATATAAAGAATLLYSTEPTNLFNPDTITNGYALSGTSAAPVVNAAYYLSGYLPIKPSTTYARTLTTGGSGKYFSFYDSNQTYLSTTLVANGATTFTTPANTAFFRTSQLSANQPASTFMVVEGNTLPDSYVPWVGKAIERKGSKNAPSGYAGLDANGKVPASAVPTADNTPNLFVASTSSGSSALAANTGSVAQDPLFYTTDYIAVTPGLPYHFSTPATAKYVAFFDASKAYIPNSTIFSGGSFTPPAGAAFARISARYGDTPVTLFQVVQGATLPIRTGLILAGKTIAGLGDSITFGFIPRNAPGYPGQLTSWLYLMAAELGAAQLNYGISGSTVASGTGSSDPMVGRYAAMSDAADLVIVMGGTNDCRNSVPLGTMGDTTGATFYGALDVLAKGLLQKYRYTPGVSAGPAKKVVFSTAIRLLDPATGGLNANLPAFNAATKQVGDRYCIPVFDAYNLSTLTPDLFRTLVGTAPGYTGTYNPYMPDGTHPSREGQHILAQAFAGFLRGLY